MLRSPRFIKTIHALFFVAFNGLLVIFAYELIVDRTTAVSVLAVVVFIVEAIILAVNGWKCPLTEHAENLGSASGRITDIFLPGWMADRAFKIYGVLFAAMIVLFLLRLLS
jgi:hypothetical protein